jgi:hypothetical protein
MRRVWPEKRKGEQIIRDVEGVEKKYYKEG